MARRFGQYQIDALNAAFEESDYLTKQKKIELVAATGLDVEQIASWFNRKRGHNKARESVGVLEQTIAELRQALQESKDRDAKLQKMLQESTKREAELEAENQHWRHKLGIIGDDLQFDPALRFINGW